MVTREITSVVHRLTKQFPIITITGPRQSGKTTLARAIFPEYDYYSMEDPDIRELATTDPRGLLAGIKDGVVFDEIQRTPGLLSYIQGIVDSGGGKGRIILTGSHQFELMEGINQSLAGRTAILRLLPFTIAELRRIKKKQNTDQFLIHGFYPGVHDKKQEPNIAYKNYFETYIERDLRQMITIKDLRLFRKFVKLCAGRIGQVFSASGLANDVGVSVPTVQSWLSILEASFIVLLLEPFYKNIGKRLIKSPKLYFYDTGLASYLLGIETESQMARDPLRGNLFENMVIMELVKKRYNQGLDHNLNFFRDSNGNEVDLLYRSGNNYIPVEIKAAETFNMEFLKGINYIRKILPDETAKGYIVYAGQTEKPSGDFILINYKNTCSIIESPKE